MRKAGAGKGIAISGLPGAPAPGAPPTTDAGLLVGVYGKVALGAMTLHFFDGEIRVTQRLVEVTGHGDEWEQWVPLRQGWTARVRGYISRSGNASSTYWNTLAKQSASPTEVTLSVYSDFDGAAGHKIFEGTCFAEDITLTMPLAMVEQEVTLRGSTTATTGPAA